EIRVHLNEKDVGYIKIPGFNTEQKTGSTAVVETTIGDHHQKWTGYVERAEIIDEKTRTIPVVIAVKDPYKTLPPLSVGTFVRVRIKGYTIDRAVLIDKEAIQWTEQGTPFVWIVDKEERLRKRMVALVRSVNGRYIVSRGLNDGEKVVITPPPVATEGMKVRIEDTRG
ncbi:MAG: hypothetical protein GXO97_02495, partial [Nitrospirae bacterium]|nr:hypothetical protein [Nitrospirota bacterium]